MGIPYELVRANLAMMGQPEYRQLHPHGKVPVLVDEYVTIFESAAICTYLADKYPDKGLAPATGTSARAYYYQWLFYATVTLEPPVEQFMFNALPDLPEKLLPKKKVSEVSAQQAMQWFERVAEPLKDAVTGKNYLVENRLTTADIITGGVLMWALRLGMLTEHAPLKAYVEKLMERPAFLRADEDFYAKLGS
jgi:glutathione S-transferase